jgi:hypothetical protein
MRLTESGYRSVVLVMGFILAVAAFGQDLAESDAEVEACLTDGKILKGAEDLVGITRPVKVEVECDGGKREAVFKNLDQHKRGSTRLESGEVEFNFSDSFRYERAAYLLDRELGLDMVPVAVLGKRKGSDGVLVDWIPNTVHENKVTTAFTGPQMASQFRQKSRMHLFDSLIYNIDRRPENILVEQSTGEIFLIDHSRAFREKKELRQEFAEGRVWLSRDFYDNLVALTAESLAELKDGLISKAQLEALLSRRDLIVAKIDADRQEYGDEAVFME